MASRFMVRRYMMMGHWLFLGLTSFWIQNLRFRGKFKELVVILDVLSRPAGFYSFTEATEVLRSNGCCVIASFLDLLLVGFKDRPTLTIFAPVDTVMKGFVGNVDEYSSIFLRHVVPCKILWKDLLNFDDRMVLGDVKEKGARLFCYVKH
ncbi:hypothetical protein GH714_017606 [Hevea brasiliensis]|uniref:FAS1 domain-containing protein n=1 Tax=Hevea brasiliensis TaxID=3981 RepID=A0A6A6MD54_HEVBR|nr:hypothetical protein GH714_017606 [Hevea brasiliensis]